VLAAGAWSGGIPCAPQPVPGSHPVRGHLIGYRAAPGLCPAILRSEETYLLQRASGLLIAGSSTENVGFDRRLDPAIVAGIARRAEALLPVLREAPAPDAWLGFRPRSDAHRPIIGRHADSALWLAYGHFRNGILLAPATAARIAAGICG
jgi:glycine oxidase